MVNLKGCLPRGDFKYNWSQKYQPSQIIIKNTQNAKMNIDTILRTEMELGREQIGHAQMVQTLRMTYDPLNNKITIPRALLYITRILIGQMCSNLANGIKSF